MKTTILILGAIANFAYDHRRQIGEGVLLVFGLLCFIVACGAALSL